MKITLTQTDGEQMEAFLTISRRGNRRNPLHIRRYKISPLGIQVGPSIEMNPQPASGAIPKSPIQLLLSTASCNWEDKIHVAGSSIHGIVLRNKGERAVPTVVCRFSFSFENTGKALLSSSEDELASMMQYDAITSAYQKRYLLQLLDWEIEKYNRLAPQQQQEFSMPPLSLVQLEVRLTKKPSKLQRPLLHDAICRHVFQQVKNRIRKSDIFAQWDHGFMLLLPSTDAEKAKNLVAELKECIEQQAICFENDHPFFVKVYVGISTYESTLSASTLLKRVKKNLSERKKANP